jgi:hypothetical protein
MAFYARSCEFLVVGALADEFPWVGGKLSYNNHRLDEEEYFSLLACCSDHLQIKNLHNDKKQDYLSHA